MKVICLDKVLCAHCTCVCVIFRVIFQDMALFSTTSGIVFDSASQELSKVESGKEATHKGQHSVIPTLGKIHCSWRKCMF